MKVQNRKYRPSLPPHLITHILELAKKEVPISRNSLDLIAILVPFEAKIAAGCVMPAYETAVKKEDKTPQESNLFNELGGASSQEIQKYETKEQYWEACYKKYKASPENCTLAEIDAAREWAYLEGLMSAEEIAAFEAECR